MADRPVLIYAMPRSYSTVMLFSCNREIKINEPFDIRRRNSEIVKTTKNVKLENILDIPFDKLYHGDWNKLTNSLNHSNTVVKILAMSLMIYYPARDWYNKAVESNSFDIFIPNRSMYDIAWSTVLATKFGFRKEWESESLEIDIPIATMKELALNFDAFLRFFPKNAVAIDIDNLPDSHFHNTSERDVRIQNSLAKKSLIKNFDECDQEIRFLIDLFANEWTSKFQSIGAIAKVW